MPQYSPIQDDTDKYYAPKPRANKYELMIHDYAKAFGLDPESDTILKRDIRKFLEFWAIENNKNAAMNYRNDHRK